MHKRFYILSALVIGSAALIAQWLPQGFSQTSALSRLQNGGRFVVGYALEPPFVFIDAEGRVSGQAPAVFRHIAAEIGPARLQWVHADFGSLIHELEAGRIDAIAAGMFVTPERAQRVLFSRPTAQVCPALLVRRNEAGVSLRLQDFLSSPALRLGVIAGAVERQLVGQAGLPASQVIDFPDTTSAMDALMMGRIDAFMLSVVSLRDTLARVSHDRSMLEVVEPGATVALPAGLPAFVFRRQDHKLRDAVDGRLGRFLGSPIHLEMVAPFGFTLAEMPGQSDVPECGP